LGLGVDLLGFYFILFAVSVLVSSAGQAMTAHSPQPKVIDYSLAYLQMYISSSMDQLFIKGILYVAFVRMSLPRGLGTLYRFFLLCD
jgi:hypothetical protein